MQKPLLLASRIAICGIALALAGSVWALFGGAGCASCRAAHEIFSGVNLALVGAIYYAALLAWMFVKGAGVWAMRGIFAAAGVHLVLVMTLLGQRLFCPACILTAIGAFAAAGAVCFLPNKAAAAARAPMTFCLAAALAFGAVFANQKLVEQSRLRTVQALIAQLKAEPQRPPAAAAAGARLVVYARPNCPYCARFEREVLPGIVAEFGKAVNIEEREAPKELPAPTIVILGKRDAWFVGVPQKERLSAAERTALGSP